MKYIFSALAIIGFIGLLLSASASDAGANFGQAATAGCLSTLALGVGIVGYNHRTKRKTARDGNHEAAQMKIS